MRSPSQNVDLGRPITVAILDKLTWDGADSPTPMDGQAIANPLFMEDYSNAIGRSTDCIQFRSILPNHGIIAKGTIRRPVYGLTTWKEWCQLANVSTDVDIITDTTVIKECPSKYINNVVDLPSTGISLHRIDDHSSSTSLTGSQMIMFGEYLQPKSDKYKFINKVSTGDRLAYAEMIDSNDYNISKIRKLEYDLPIDEFMHHAIFHQHLRSYVANNIVNTKVRGGSRFLCTDPAIQYGDAWVSRSYHNNISMNKTVFDTFNWISTPTISKDCIKRVNVKIIDDTVNLIFIHHKMAFDGFRDFDGDLAKII